MQSTEKNNSFFKISINYRHNVDIPSLSKNNIDEFFRGDIILEDYITNLAMVWGPTGHRVVGEVASKYISEKTKKVVSKILKGNSIASVADYADQIRADEKYKKLSPWHFLDFYGQTYYPEAADPEGDLIFAITKCIKVLKDKKSTEDDKFFYLKLLIHFIGDLHQPLHVSMPGNRGGNDIKVTWFGQESNLHRVWDSGMINTYEMSYTELSADLPPISEEQKKQIQKGTILEWAYDSHGIAPKIEANVRDFARLSYEYQYYNFPTVKTQLQKGGLRLAKLLDEIFK